MWTHICQGKLCKTFKTEYFNTNKIHLGHIHSHVDFPDSTSIFLNTSSCLLCWPIRPNEQKLQLMDGYYDCFQADLNIEIDTQKKNALF